MSYFRPGIPRGDYRIAFMEESNKTAFQFVIWSSAMKNRTLWLQTKAPWAMVTTLQPQERPTTSTSERPTLAQGHCFREQATAPSAEHSFQISVKQHKNNQTLNAAEIQSRSNTSLFHATSLTYGEWQSTCSCCNAKWVFVHCLCWDGNLNCCQTETTLTR